MNVSFNRREIKLLIELLENEISERFQHLHPETLNIELLSGDDTLIELIAKLNNSYEGYSHELG